MVRLVIVTGSGRSGTSCVAGTLKRLGFHIPQPEIAADERNPRGYYEPEWVAGFHKTWLNRIPVRTIDARPDAGDIAMATLTPQLREQLHDWLEHELAQRAPGDVVVVKETRAYWVYPMWQGIARDLGVELSSLTMLRHPTQVVRSRDAAYLTGETAETRLQRETANVAAWMNSVFVTERATRGNERAFVLYSDLVGDWRSTMTRTCAQIGAQIGAAPGDLAAPHPIDDFISPWLNRSAGTWNGLRVPGWLRDLAEETWLAARALVERPHDEPTIAGLDELRQRYAAIYAASSAIASDEAEGLARARADPVHRELRRHQRRLERKNLEIKVLRDELRRLRAGETR